MIKVGCNAVELGKSSGVGGSTTFEGLSDKATADIPAINVPLATALSDKEATANKKTDVAANNTSDTFFPSVKAVFDWVSGLFVKGAASSTDNAIARFDGITGKVLQNSGVTIDDSSNITMGGYTTNENILPAIRLDYRQTPLTGDKLAFFGRGAFTLPNTNTVYLGSIVNGIVNAPSYNFGILLSSATRSRYELAFFDAENARLGILTTTPTSTLDVNGTSRIRGSATFNGQIIDNAGSAGTDGQVLKKVGGLVLWSNP